MTHESSHVIIHLATPMNSAKPKGLKVWHCLVPIVAMALLIGYAIGQATA